MKPRWLDCWRWFYAIALVRFREIVTQVELADRFLGKPRGANISSPNFSGKTGGSEELAAAICGQDSGEGIVHRGPIHCARRNRAEPVDPDRTDKGRITEDDERGRRPKKSRPTPQLGSQRTATNGFRDSTVSAN